MADPLDPDPPSCRLPYTDVLHTLNSTNPLCGSAYFSDMVSGQRSGFWTPVFKVRPTPRESGQPIAAVRFTPRTQFLLKLDVS